MVDYVTRNNSWTIGEYWKETNHGYTPFMKVPVFTITNSYHQMELGTVFWDAVVTNPTSYLAPMSDNVLRWGYCLLDEAFASDINVYEGVNLWNGADYRVPNSMSLTYDMLFNPFEFPYIVDCCEEIIHYTEATQEYKENGFYYDIEMELEFIVPATVSISLPTSVYEGSDYDVDIGMELDSSDICVRFEYDILLGYVLEWWFVSIDEDMHFEGDGSKFIAAFQARIEHILKDNGAYFDGKNNRGHAQTAQSISFNIMQPYPMGPSKGLYPTIDINP